MAKVHEIDPQANSDLDTNAYLKGELARRPDWLRNGKPSHRDTQPREEKTTSWVGASSPEQLTRATAYVRKVARESPAVDGQGGSGQTFKVCCILLHGFHLAKEE